MADTVLFQKYLQLADQLAHAASKDDLASCAMLLAINVAHYESKYGELPLDETLTIAYTNDSNEAQLKLMTKGLETMVGVLGGLVQGYDHKLSH